MHYETIDYYLYKKYHFISQVPVDEICFYSSSDLRKTELFSVFRENNTMPVYGHLISNPEIIVIEVYKHNSNKKHYLNRYAESWDNIVEYTAEKIKNDLRDPIFLLQSDDHSILKYKLKY